MFLDSTPGTQKCFTAIACHFQSFQKFLLCKQVLYEPKPSFQMKEHIWILTKRFSLTS